MVELHEVTLCYGDKIVLEDLNLNVTKGERLVILGASGSGKSSLLRLIAGFIAPDSGEVLIGGRVVSRAGEILVPPHRRDVAMVFQDLALWGHMNVEENIGFGLKMRGVSKKERIQRVEAMLKTVGLEGYGKRRIDLLSGGEQQRVALARALILSPKVLLMDEPLSSLDRKLNQKLRGEILRLHEVFGFTLLYVTHNEEEAEEIGERTISMNNGKIVLN